MSGFLRIDNITRHDFSNSHIRVFRDDLYPFPGGSKARKIQEMRRRSRNKMPMLLLQQKVFNLITAGQRP